MTDTNTKPAKVAKPTAAFFDESIVTGTVTMSPVDGTASDAMTLTILKGDTDAGTIGYQAAYNGKSGKVAGSLVAAINDLLKSGLGLLPAAWVVPAKVSEVKFPEIGDNKPPKEKAPETLDELPVERQAELRDMAETLAHDFETVGKAEKTTRQAIRNFAVDLRQVRLSLNKAEWKIFTKLPAADTALAAFLSDANKNAVSEYVGLAGIPDELFALVPAGKNSAKAVAAWLGGMRNAIAVSVVETIKQDAELSTTGIDAAFQQLMESHAQSVVDGEASPIGIVDEATRMLCAIHWDNVQGVERCFDMSSDGGLIPRKADKVNVTKAAFGIDDRADELIAAVCRAFNSFIPAVDKAVTADMREKTKALVANAKAFQSWSADEVARHLFNILAGRVDETTDENLADTCAFADVVIDKLAGWIGAIADGTMTVADVLAIGTDSAAPVSEDDAEQDADATV